MKATTVKDLMVPLSKYATVSEETTLWEAVMTLEKAQEQFDQTRYRHRAILAFDKNNRIVGKISQLDVLKALEPKYAEMVDLESLSRSGFSPDFQKSMLEEYGLWDKPLDHLCEKAAQVQVKSIMYTPTEGEYIEESTSLNEAIHQLIIGRHQSLLVTRGGNIVGILRLTDIFMAVCRMMRACKLQ